MSSFYAVFGTPAKAAADASVAADKEARKKKEMQATKQKEEKVARDGAASARNNVKAQQEKADRDTADAKSADKASNAATAAATTHTSNHGKAYAIGNNHGKVALKHAKSVYRRGRVIRGTVVARLRTGKYVDCVRVSRLSLGVTCVGVSETLGFFLCVLSQACAARSACKAGVLNRYGRTCT